MAKHKVSRQAYHCQKSNAKVDLTIIRLCLPNGYEMVTRLNCDKQDECEIAKSTNPDGFLLTRRNCAAGEDFLGCYEQGGNG